MSLRFRRFLYIFFLLLFFLLAPIVSLYSAGYYLDWHRLFYGRIKLEKTGLLSISSDPRETEIFLNRQGDGGVGGNLAAAKSGPFVTPAKINRLRPGEYNLRLEKEGYWPWQEKISIRAGESTLLKEIILYQKNSPWLTVPEAKYIYFSESGESALLAGAGGQSAFFNWHAEKAGPWQTDATSTVKESGCCPQPLWSAANDYFLYHGWLFENKNGQFLNRRPLAASSSLYRWSEEKENTFTYLAAGKILAEATETGATSSFFQLPRMENILDYLAKDNKIYLISLIGRGGLLEIYQTDAKPLAAISLPHSAHFRFWPKRGRLINLYDEDNSLLYLLDENDRVYPLQETIANVRRAQWLSDSLLLYANDFEIWLYDQSARKKIFLTRLSREITGLFPLTDKNFLFTTRQEINLLELDLNGSAKITALFAGPDLEQCALSPDKKTFFSIATIGNQQGLFRLNIR